MPVVDGMRLRLRWRLRCRWFWNQIWTDRGVSPSCCASASRSRVGGNGLREYALTRMSFCSPEIQCRRRPLASVPGGVVEAVVDDDDVVEAVDEASAEGRRLPPVGWSTALAPPPPPPVRIPASASASTTSSFVIMLASANSPESEMNAGSGDIDLSALLPPSLPPSSNFPLRPPASPHCPTVFPRCFPHASLPSP